MLHIFYVHEWWNLTMFSKCYCQVHDIGMFYNLPQLFTVLFFPSLMCILVATAELIIHNVYNNIVMMNAYSFTGKFFVPKSYLIEVAWITISAHNYYMGKKRRSWLNDRHCSVTKCNKSLWLFRVEKSLFRFCYHRMLCACSTLII